MKSLTFLIITTVVSFFFAAYLLYDILDQLHNPLIILCYENSLTGVHKYNSVLFRISFYSLIKFLSTFHHSLPFHLPLNISL
jgi:hypothetical protein